ncbi:myeloid cell surface antigen CD33-like isoform X1 [Peromyscus californicus insignis]|uniref:myeloid cell surface antigen CD33-like isoform X1 n=1 Tax=Peromyscus californicus insignis TaxID=564181 RepID=UPI0022A7A92A|nr:myeloid cell surface antigen CD33-like isoform X1 [Peromyscus californicus insignis]
MQLLLLLLLVWVHHWTLRAKPSTATECKDERYKVEVLEMVLVQEGLCVLVPCTFTGPRTYPVQVYGSWFHTGADRSQDSAVATNNPEQQVLKETRGRFHLVGDMQSNNCSLDIRDAQRGDNGSYFFMGKQQRKSQWSSCGKPVSVHVTALIYKPHIFPLETLKPGCPRNLTCSVPWACERGTPPIFSWMSAALTSLGPRTTLSSVLTLTPRPQDHGTNLTCQVTFPGAGVTVERTIQLNVTSGNPGRKSASGVILGAIGGAGVTALLSVSICLIFFIVKAHRKKAARTAVSMSHMHPTVESLSQCQQQDSKVHSHVEDPTLGIEQEVHYASLSFHRSAPRKETSP